MHRLLFYLLALGMHLPSVTARARTPEDVVSHHLQAIQERNDLALRMLVQQRMAGQTGATDVPVDAPPMAVLLATWTRNIELMPIRSMAWIYRILPGRCRFWPTPGASRTEARNGTA